MFCFFLFCLNLAEIATDSNIPGMILVRVWIKFVCVLFTCTSSCGAGASGEGHAKCTALFQNLDYCSLREKNERQQQKIAPLSLSE